MQYTMEHLMNLTKLLFSLTCLTTYTLFSAQRLITSRNYNLNEMALSGVEPSGEKRKVAIKECYYYIALAKDLKKRLEKRDNALGVVNKDYTSNTLFKFMPQQTGFFTIYDSQGKSIAQEKSFQSFKIISVAGEKMHLRLVFKDAPTSGRESFLECTDKNTCQFSSIDSNDLSSKPQGEWCVIPAYDTELLLQDPAAKNVDPVSLLLKIPDHDPISKKALTPEHIIALYALHCPSGKALSLLVDKKENQYLGFVTGMWSAEGVYLCPDAKTSIKVNKAKGYQVGKGKDCTEACGNAKICSVDEEITGERGEVIFIAPLYNNLVPREFFGDLSVSLIKHNITNNQETLYTLYRLHIQENDKHLDDFLITRDNNFCMIKRCDESPMANSAALARGLSSGISAGLREGLKGIAGSLDNVAKGIENFGISLEKASHEASQALVDSTKEASEALQLATYALADSLLYATKTFELAVRLLSESADKASSDFRASAKFLSQSLSGASENLKIALGSLTEGVGEASDSFQEASIYFSKGLTGASEALSRSLVQSSQDFSQALSDASNNFKKGMECLKKIKSKNKVKFRL